jgi:hypothetical protein
MLRAGGLNFEADAFAVLEEADDLEEIVRARITPRSQHSHQTLGWNARRFGKIAEAQGCVNVIAQDGLRRGYVAREHGFNSFPKKLFAELGIALDASANGFFEIASE